MIANSQYKLKASDLELILALVRTHNLMGAAERLGVNSSTVFRTIRHIERSLGHELFERSRTGYLPTEQTLLLAEYAEKIEAQLEQARSEIQLVPKQVSGIVRITTTDTILHGLIAPSLHKLSNVHPLLEYELHTGNELTSLTRREADIAVRATKHPPHHLIGKHIGTLNMALYAGTNIDHDQLANFGKVNWIVPDDALPDHPSVIWRKRHYPKAVLRYRVNSILTVMEFISAGMGVGVLPVFLAQQCKDLIALTDILEECETELWILTHPESRHLLRVSSVFRHLSETLKL